MHDADEFDDEWTDEIEFEGDEPEADESPLCDTERPWLW
jgi:hypothetical protein